MPFDALAGPQDNFLLTQKVGRNKRMQNSPQGEFCPEGSVSFSKDAFFSSNYCFYFLALRTSAYASVLRISDLSVLNLCVCFLTNTLVMYCVQSSYSVFKVLSEVFI